MALQREHWISLEKYHDPPTHAVAADLVSARVPMSAHAPASACVPTIPTRPTHTNQKGETLCHA
jgi:hypothetical protein